MKPVNDDSQYYPSRMLELEDQQKKEEELKRRMRRYDWSCKSEDQINVRHEIQFRKDLKFLRDKVK